MGASRILIVEDEHIIGLHLKEQVERLGYSVCSIVSSGGAAVDEARKQKPDLILMDIFLNGDMDGIEAAEKIRSEQITPIVYTTGHLEDEWFQRARRSLPLGYLVKPLRDRELKIAVEMALSIGESEASRSAAEEELRKSKANLESIFRASPIGIGLMENRVFKRVNDTLCNMLGYSADELLGKSVGMLYADDEEYRRVVRDKYRQMAEEGTGVVETLWRRKDGTIFDVLLSATYLDSSVTFTALDITERMHAEKALRESEKKYRDLVENINEVSFTLDGEGRFTYISPVVGRKTERQPDHFIGRHFGEFIHPDDLPNLWEKISALASGKVQEFEFRYGAPNGTSRWASVSARPRLDEQGRLTQVTGLWSDITERKLAEQELQWESSVNSALSALSHVMISPSYDMGSVTGMILDYARELTGSEHGFVASIDEATGDVIRHTFTETMRTQCRMDEVKTSDVRLRRGRDGRYPSLWGHGLNTKEPFISNNPTEHPAATGLPKGHIPIKRFLNVPVCYGDELIGQIALANSSRDYTQRDLTAVSQLAEFYALALRRERTEEERDRMEKTLHHAQKMEAIGTLAGGVAHDFNNLLHAIQGYTQLVLLDTPPEDPRHHSLLQVEKAAQRGAGLIRQLLMFSRKTEVRKQPLNLNDTVRRMHNFLERTIPKMIRIDLQLARNLPSVNADANQMEQVLMNLALNARDAMQDGGTILIRTERTDKKPEFVGEKNEFPSGPYVMLTFSDSGAGMDRETREHAFEPFFTTKETGKGSGLGLASVYGIVQSHGGSVACESEPGAGATFKICLPALTDQKTEALTEPALRGSPEEDETVLLVDDEEPIRELGRQVLSRFGYTVITATDGESALDLVERNDPPVDLVILDIVMPGMGGIKCLQKLLERNEKMRVLVASGYTGGEGMHNVLPPGAKGFIHKPYHVEEMLEAVRSALA